MKSLSALYLLLGSFLQWSEKPWEEITPTDTHTDAYSLQLSLHVIECKRRQAEAIFEVEQPSCDREIIEEEQKNDRIRGHG